MTSDTLPPPRARILVIGGGPGGSMAAILLAREGFEVVLLEREKFPRYHIGESLLTSVISVLKFVGLYERTEAHGFKRKHGGFFTLKEGSDPGHIDFRKVSVHRHSYQVKRAEFDHLLLQYAAEMGAKVFEETSVTSVDLEGDQPVRAHWHNAAGDKGEIAFDYLVDASGVSGVMSTKVLHNRELNESFTNVAVGSYWRGYSDYVSPDGQKQEGDFYMEALNDGSGWVWAIPLHDDTISVGIVVHTDEFQRMRGKDGTPEDVYRMGLSRTRYVQSTMLKGAEQVQPVRVWRDFSYTASSFGGARYRLVGDAAAFIDPLFSTGVHLAFLGALSASATISAQIRGEIDEEVAVDFHNQCIRKAYTRFSVIVTGMYKQIRRQDEVVLYGVQQADFRHAFDVILPLVSGSTEITGEEVDPEVISKAVDFTIDMMNERAQLGSDNPAAKLFIQKASVHEDLTADLHGAVGGRYIRLERGRLGLDEVGAAQIELDREKKELVDELLQAAAES